jgi:hypothetical protein
MRCNMRNKRNFIPKCATCAKDFNLVGMTHLSLAPKGLGTITFL